MVPGMTRFTKSLELTIQYNHRLSFPNTPTGITWLTFMGLVWIVNGIWKSSLALPCSCHWRQKLNYPHPSYMDWDGGVVAYLRKYKALRKPENTDLVNIPISLYQRPMYHSFHDAYLRAYLNAVKWVDTWEIRNKTYGPGKHLWEILGTWLNANSDSAELRWGQRPCISYKLPGNIEPAGPCWYQGSRRQKCTME